MIHENLKYWLALHLIEGLGNVGIRNLIDAFQSPEPIFHATLQEIKKVPGISGKAAANILAFNDWRTTEEELERTEKSRVSIVTLHDPSYPKNLLQIHDCPSVLYVRGSLIEEDVYVSVVGSRQASTYGKFCTERLSRELAMNGVTVVSGMARGIDSAAHRGALTGKGRTVAVLGCGIDVVYPPENQRLHDEIAAHGAVITEFPFSTPPNGPNFPARNRIISGMSLGVVIVEANERSGSLITARLALEQGREVFAVPGEIDSPGSRGTHKLIREGAKLIMNVHDILEEIVPQLDKNTREKICKKSTSPPETKTPSVRPSLPAPDVDEKERVVLSLISENPMDVDTIIDTAGFSAPEIMNILLSLELKGYVDPLPGKRYIIRKDSCQIH